MNQFNKLEPMPDKNDVIINGSTWAAIWYLSWPLVIDMMMLAVANLVEVWVAGRIGSTTQAALAVAGQIGFFMMLLTLSFSAGTTALVSRSWGARDRSNAVEAARQALFFAIVFGVISTSIAWLTARPLLMLLGTVATVQILGWAYLKLAILAYLPFVVLWISNAILRAKGNTRAPMATMLVVNTAIIILDLVLCIWPLHGGIQGLAVSRLIANTCGVLLVANILKQSEIKDCLNLYPALVNKNSRQWLWRLLKVSLPVCIQDLIWVGSNFILFKLFAMTNDPTSCQAAWSIGLCVDDLVNVTPAYGLGMAAATIIGQNLGAKQLERAVQSGWQIAKVGLAFGVLVGLVVFISAQIIACFMSQDLLVIRHSIQFLQILAFTEPLLAVWVILFRAMEGAGYTRWPTLITLGCLIGFRLPLAFLLTVILHWGATGVWLSIALTTAVMGLMAIWLFQRGTWKHNLV